MQTPSSHPLPLRRVLIIKPGAVGDLLHLTPTIRALKRANPEAELTVLVGHQTSLDLFRNNPLVDKTIVYDRKGMHRSISSRIAFLKDLRSRRFDLVLNFQRSNITTWLFIAAIRPDRVLVYHKARKRMVHAVVNYLETLAPLGVTSDDLALEFAPGAEAERFADELFARNRLSAVPVVALNTGATRAVNRWPAERFVELADLLAERLAVRCIIVGGPDDVQQAEDIRSRTRSQPLSLAGATSLLELGAVLGRCTAVVTADTGPMHVATAVRTPVVALFGASAPERTGPVGTGHRVIMARGLSCSPCQQKTCNNAMKMECMSRITAEEVAREVEAILAARHERAAPV